MDGEAVLRIGEVSRRSGVSPELLRAWERRYGLLRPARSPGGLRLYSEADVERVRAMRRHLAAGVAAAEAAALASEATPAGLPGGRPELDAAGARADLAAALDAFDEPPAQAMLDRLLAAASADVVLVDVVLPYLRELGERWRGGEVSVAQEHFASGILRGRLLGLARGWGVGIGPLAVLACLPGEQHELGLIAFGLALRARGWRIAYLGADTPLETLRDACRSLGPALVVLGATMPAAARKAAAELGRLDGCGRIAVGGAAAAEAAGGAGDTLVLAGDPVAEAERLTALVAARR